jgi:hypothetical protein
MKLIKINSLNYQSDGIKAAIIDMIKRLFMKKICYQ